MMAKPPLEQHATPYRLWLLFQQRVLPLSAWERAHELAGFIPTASDWRSFIDRLMLILGAVFGVAGIFFFFAFNWADLHRFARFGILQAALVILVLLAFFLKLDSWGGRVTLMAAALLIGTNKAVVGQAYQTGADSYRLFMMWLIFITGWVLISHWNVMWLIWMVLINTTVVLYWEQIIGGNYQTLNLIVIGINTVFLFVWDTLVLLNIADFLKDRWILYIFALEVLGHATYFMLDAIFAFENRYIGLSNGWAIYIGVLVIFVAFYSLFQRDLLMITLSALSLLIVVMSAMIHFWFSTDTADPIIAFFCLGSVAVGLTGVMVMGLRRLQKRWEGQVA